MLDNLRILFATTYDNRQHIWDETANAPDRRQYYEINAGLCQGDGGLFITSDYEMVPQALAQYPLDVAMFMLPICRVEHEHERIPDVIQAVQACQAARVPAVTVMADDCEPSLHGHSNNAVEYVKMLNQFDALLTPGDEIHHGMGYIATPPRYRWTAASEVCRMMKDQPYPDGARDLIVFVRHHAEHAGCSWGGTIHNYYVLKALLEAFPQYTGVALCPMREFDSDVYLDFLGIADRVLPATKDYRPWEEIIHILSRSKLAVHMEFGPTRSQFLLECAACGVPIIGTNTPQSARFLGVGDTHSGWMFEPVITAGMTYLSDQSLWDIESHRLFMMAKARDLTLAKRTLDRILQKYREDHP